MHVAALVLAVLGLAVSEHASTLRALPQRHPESTKALLRHVHDAIAISDLCEAAAVASLDVYVVFC